jgi:hypothetical protein
MESGLKNVPALSVARLFASEQPIANQFPKQHSSGIANETVLASDQDFVNEFRLVNQIELLIQQTEIGDWSIAPGHLRKKQQGSARIASSQEAKYFHTSRTWGPLHEAIVA